jgi:hypothetical protein
VNLFPVRKKLYLDPISGDCGMVICNVLSFEEQCKFFRVPQENLFNSMIFELRFYVERELVR